MNYNKKTMRYGMLISRMLFLSTICMFAFVSATNSQTMTSAQKKIFKKNFKQATLLLDNGLENRSDEKLSDTVISYFKKCYSLDSNNANVSYLIGPFNIKCNA